MSKRTNLDFAAIHGTGSPLTIPARRKPLTFWHMVAATAAGLVAGRIMLALFWIALN